LVGTGEGVDTAGVGSGLGVDVITVDDVGETEAVAVGEDSAGEGVMTSEVGTRVVVGVIVGLAQPISSETMRIGTEKNNIARFIVCLPDF
jgi:hypothetical protein